MNLMLSLDPQLAKKKIGYNNKLLLMGSCFSDNIGAKLQEAKFDVLVNPTGIVFDPLSLATHLTDYVSQKQYTEKDVFERNELWHSWLHHSDFSSPKKEDTLALINQSVLVGHKQLQEASHLFITLGTAFSYKLIDKEMSVANCHKAPKEWFEKGLLSIDEMVLALQKSMQLIKELNPTIEIVFTVSPVKHIRDGIVENNRSKARLLEVVHRLVEQEKQCSYFPAYEWVTDVLRDYRFYTPDMAHPNELGIEFVFEHFCETYFTHETKQLMGEVLHIVVAKKHRALHATSTAHQQFLKVFLNKTELLKAKLPFLDLTKELNYFSGS